MFASCVVQQTAAVSERSGCSNHSVTTDGCVVAEQPFTVISVRDPKGKLTLYCKGADTIIFERLHPSCNNLKEVTNRHLNVSDAVGCLGCVR